MSFPRIPQLLAFALEVLAFLIDRLLIGLR